MASRDVKNTEIEDLDLIFELFEQSILYQEQKGYPVWKNYDRNAIIRDVVNKQHYKIVIDFVTAIVFSVCYSDKVIWRNRDKGDSVYFHQIVVIPQCNG